MGKPMFGPQGRPRFGVNGRPLLCNPASACCGEKTIRICSPGIFSAGQYDLHLRIYDGAYENKCDTCAKLEASTFVVPYNGGNSYYREIQNFGSPCMTSRLRWLTIGVIFGCNPNTGNWTAKGSLHGKSGIVWWGERVPQNSGSALAIGRGPFTTGFNAVPWDIGTPNLIVGREYELAPLTVFDDGHAGGFASYDCRAASRDLNQGPKIGIALVRR